MNRLPSIFPSPTSALFYPDDPTNVSPAASAISSNHRPLTVSSLYTQQHEQTISTGPWDNLEEARAFTYYTRTLAPWLDICDRDRHFEIEVPKLACHSPLLAASILAFATCQLALIKRFDASINPAKYNSRALTYLIPLLDEPMEALDENVLAAICLLRLVEEMEDNDLAAHLAGSSRLVNLSLAARGGLSEAASWIVLRQDMYICLTRRQPLSIDLTTFELSRAFIDTNPESLANRAVYLCAKVLERGIGPTSPSTASNNTWGELLEALREWTALVPPEYSILYAGRGSEGSDVPSPSFPTVWVTHAAFVAGYQHIYLARMLIYMLHPYPVELPQVTDAGHKTSAIKDLRLIVGIAMSNPDVINGSFTACHTLQSAGGLLESEIDREAAVRFLRNVNKSTGWRTAHVIEELRSQWGAFAPENQRKDVWPLDYLV